MNLTEYEKACIRSWSLDHAQTARGKDTPAQIDALISDAAKISGFIMGVAEAELVDLKTGQKTGSEDTDAGK